MEDTSVLLFLLGFLIGILLGAVGLAMLIDRMTR